MKAFNVLMFLIAFNLSLNIMVIIVGQSAVPAGGDVGLETSIFGIGESGEGIIIALIAGIAIASVTIIGTQASKPIGIVVGAFGGFYLVMFQGAMDVIENMKIEAHHLVPPLMVDMFIVFNVIVFIIGIFQLVSGGWRSAK